MNNEKYYNQLSEICLINLYTISKEKEKVELKGFSFKNKQHLFLLNIAGILHNLYGYEIILETKFLDFIKYKIHTKHLKFIHRKAKLENGIDIEDFLNHIADAQIIERNIWNKIYEEFFGGANV